MSTARVVYPSTKGFIMHCSFFAFKAKFKRKAARCRELLDLTHAGDSEQCRPSHSHSRVSLRSQTSASRPYTTSVRRRTPREMYVVQRVAHVSPCESADDDSSHAKSACHCFEHDLDTSSRDGAYGLRRSADNEAVPEMLEGLHRW